MASKENRSPFHVSVKNNTNLTKTFAFSAKAKATAYFQELQHNGYKPNLIQGDSKWAVRIRTTTGTDQFLTARNEAEANVLIARLEAEQRRFFLPEYSAALRTTLADCLIRYLKDELPRLKSYWVEG